MFISGLKRKEKKLGFVADFCPLCREPQVFEFYRIGLAKHIYYVALGEGKLGGHFLRCTACQTPYSGDPRRYVAVEPRTTHDLSTLQQETFPRLPQAYAERLAIEERLRHSPAALNADERASYLLEPFRLANLEVEMRYNRETEFDGPATVGCFGTILLALSLAAGSLLLPYPRSDNFLIAAGGVLSLGTIYTLVQLGFAPARFMRRRIAPLLARCLAPLEPTREELQSCLKLCRGMDLKIGHKLKLPVLWSALQRRITHVLRA